MALKPSYADIAGRELNQQTAPPAASHTEATAPLKEQSQNKYPPGNKMENCDKILQDLPPQITLEQIELLLQKSLKVTSDYITTSLTKEIRDLGKRTSALELRADVLEKCTADFSSEIDNLKEENLTLQTRLEDYENRARRSNIRIRGIPETVIDLQATMTALFQELQPGIPVERLEMDRVHRALAPKKTDGPPRDIIAKFHYYRTKELLLNAARHKNTLQFQAYNYQLFTDLSQLTINKRRALKPLLQILQRNNIIYQWGFPFSVRFSYQNHKYTCRSAMDLQTTLQNVGLMNAVHDATDSRRKFSSHPDKYNSSSASRENEDHSPNKRLRQSSPVPDPCDSMD